MSVNHIKSPLFLSLFAAIGMSPAPVSAGENIANVAAVCRGQGPAILLNVSGIRSSEGDIRVQTYRAVKSEWLKKGQWLKRIEQPARKGAMSFCLPVDQPGTYAVAVRHDRNGNGKTDFTKDGGGMSNNPSISIWNLGKPSYRKVGVEVRKVAAVSIRMRYM